MNCYVLNCSTRSHIVHRRTRLSMFVYHTVMLVWMQKCFIFLLHFITSCFPISIFIYCCVMEVRMKEFYFCSYDRLVS